MCNNRIEWVSLYLRVSIFFKAIIIVKVIAINIEFNLFKNGLDFYKNNMTYTF